MTVEELLMQWLKALLMLALQTMLDIMILLVAMKAINRRLMLLPC